MKLNQQQLSSNLQQGLKPIYLVSGDETLLVQESCDMIRSICKEQGFTERESHHVDAKFKWDDVLLSSNSMSLFADKKLIELHCKSEKIGDSGSKGLQSLLQDPNPDTIFLVIMPKLAAAQQKSKWFKAVDAIGITLPIWPIDRANLPRWIQNRLHQHGLSATDDAVNFMADNVEGNLLAAQQEIEKLRLLAKNENIDLETVTEMVSNSSRYTVFNLTDKCLAGDISAAIRTLNGLKAEGTDATIILWSLTRELRVLYKIQTAQQNGQPMNQAMRNERIFDSRQNIVQNALRRLSKNKIERLLRKARLIDQSIKGIKPGSPWMQLEQLTVNFCSR